MEKESENDAAPATPIGHGAEMRTCSADEIPIHLERYSGSIQNQIRGFVAAVARHCPQLSRSERDGFISVSLARGPRKRAYYYPSAKALRETQEDVLLRALASLLDLSADCASCGVPITAEMLDDVRFVRSASCAPGEKMLFADPVGLVSSLLSSIEGRSEPDELKQESAVPEGPADGRDAAAVCQWVSEQLVLQSGAAPFACGLRFLRAALQIGVQALLDPGRAASLRGQLSRILELQISALQEGASGGTDCRFQNDFSENAPDGGLEARESADFSADGPYEHLMRSASPLNVARYEAALRRAAEKRREAAEKASFDARVASVLDAGKENERLVAGTAADCVCGCRPARSLIGAIRKKCIHCCAQLYREATKTSFFFARQSHLMAAAAVGFSDAVELLVLPQVTCKDRRGRFADDYAQEEELRRFIRRCRELQEEAERQMEIEETLEPHDLEIEIPRNRNVEMDRIDDWDWLNDEGQPVRLA